MCLMNDGKKICIIYKMYIFDFLTRSGNSSFRKAHKYTSISVFLIISASLRIERGMVFPIVTIIDGK